MLPSLKFLKPKILAVDCDESISQSILASGYNISSGTFGSRYYVEQNDTCSPVITDESLPNHCEQEIVVIDLSCHEPNYGPKGEKRVSFGTQDIWVSNQRGLIDSRPRAMVEVRKDFDQILKHGGCFIVFCEPQFQQNTWLAKGNQYGNLGSNAREFLINNYSFLTCLGAQHFTFANDGGNEIQIIPSRISNALARHIKNAEYKTTIVPDVYIGTENRQFSYLPLLKNKYGKSVGGLLTCNDSDGMVLLLPQFADKATLVLELISGLLPEIIPSLFPYDDRNAWQHDEAYEHSRIIALRREQERLRSEADSAIDKLQAAIEEEEKRLKPVHELLTSSGDSLVASVKFTLECIGFTKVIDADTTIEEGKPKQEDLQILHQSPAVLVEIKGLNGMPTEGDTIQVVKYIPRRMKEWGRLDITGLVVVNHQRGIAPLDRDHVNVFTNQQIQDAEHHDIVMVTTWELFRILRAKQEYEWPAEVLLPLFYQKGRLKAVPSHWQEIGTIAHFYDKNSAVSIHLSASLSIGVSLGYVLDDRFVQEPLTEMQLNKKNVLSAAPNDRVGVVTSLKRADLRVGTIVYAVKQ